MNTSSWLPQEACALRPSQSVGDEDDGVAVHCPLRRVVDVAAVGHVVYPASVHCGYDADVAVRVTAVGDEGQGKPFAVRRPVVLEFPIVLCAVGNLTDLAGLKVEHL